MIKNYFMKSSIKHFLLIFVAILGIVVIATGSPNKSQAQSKSTVGPDVTVGISGVAAQMNTVNVVSVPSGTNLTLSWMAYRNAPTSNNFSMYCQAYNWDNNQSWHAGSSSQMTLGDSFNLGKATSAQTYWMYCFDRPGGVAQWAGVTVEIAAPGSILNATLMANKSTGVTYLNNSGNLTLSWTTQGATSCNISGYNIQGKSVYNVPNLTLPNGSLDLGAQKMAETDVYTLSCSNGSSGVGNIVTSSVSVQVAAPPTTAPQINSFTINNATSATVSYGSSATLTWFVSGTIDKCTGTSDPVNSSWNGATFVTSGTQNILSITRTTKFSLTCSNSSNQTATSSVTATVKTADPLPTVNFSASPTSVDSGGSSTLTWSTKYATSCSASGNWNGDRAASGTETIKNITSAESFTLACIGSGGSNTVSVNVDVNQPQNVTADIEVNGQKSTTIPVGEEVTVTTHCGGPAKFAELADTNGDDLPTPTVPDDSFNIGPFYQNTAVELLCSPNNQFAENTNTATTTTVKAVAGLTTTNQCILPSNPNKPPDTTKLPTANMPVVGSIVNIAVAITGSGPNVLFCITPAEGDMTIVSGQNKPIDVLKGSDIKLEWHTADPAFRWCHAGTGDEKKDPNIKNWQSGDDEGPNGTKNIKLDANALVSITCAKTTGYTPIVNRPIVKTTTKSQQINVTEAPPTPAPTVTLSASPNPVQTGGTLTLTWTTTNNPDKCTASDGWTGDKAKAGSSETVTAPTTAGKVTYTITCTNANPTPATKSVDVDVTAKPTPPPTPPPSNGITMSVTPRNDISVKQSFTLTWNAQGVTALCDASGTDTRWANTQQKPNGTWTNAANKAGVFIYSLNCTAADGTKLSKSVGLIVNSPTNPSTGKIWGHVCDDVSASTCNNLLANARVDLLLYSGDINTSIPVNNTATQPLPKGVWVFLELPLKTDYIIRYQTKDGKFLYSDVIQAIAVTKTNNAGKGPVNIHVPANTPTTSTSITIAATENGQTAIKGNVVVKDSSGKTVTTTTTDQPITLTKAQIAANTNFTATITDPNQPNASPVVLNLTLNDQMDSANYGVTFDTTAVGCQEHDSAGVKIFYCGTTAQSYYNNSKYASVWTDISTTLNNLKSKYNMPMLAPVYINSNSQVSDDYISGSTSATTCPPAGEKFEITTGLIDKATSTTSNYMTYLYGVRKDYLNYGGCNWASDQPTFSDYVNTLLGLTADATAYATTINEQTYYPTMNITTPVTNQEIYATVFHIKSQYPAQLLANIQKGSSTLLNGFNQLILYVLATSQK